MAWILDMQCSLGSHRFGDTLVFRSKTFFNVWLKTHPLFTHTYTFVGRVSLSYICEGKKSTLQK